MKIVLLACLATSLLAACSKKEADPQPQPAPAAPVAPIQAATINVAFDAYATASAPAATQSLSLLATKPTYQLFTDRLEVKLQATDPGNSSFVQDRVQFVIPISRQKSGLVGTYTLASQPDASLGDVLLTYTRYINLTDTYPNAYGSNAQRLEGSFVITSYDATRRLISGSYTVKALNAKDAFVFLNIRYIGDQRRDGDLRLTGTFQEVPLQ